MTKPKHYRQRGDTDTLVLGCTHYPTLRGTIERVLGEKVKIVDSAETTARAVAESVGAQNGRAPTYTFLVTDAERFRTDRRGVSGARHRAAGAGFAVSSRAVALYLLPKILPYLRTPR